MNGVDELALKVGRIVLGLAAGTAAVGAGIGMAKAIGAAASSPLTGNAIAAVNASQLRHQGKAIDSIDRNTVAIPSIAGSSRESADSLHRMNETLEAMARHDGAVMPRSRVPEGFGGFGPSDFDSDAGQALRKALMEGQVRSSHPRHGA